MPQTGKDTVKVLEKALVLLDELKAAPNPLGVNELAKRTSVKVATAHRLLQTMKAHGWVFQNSKDKYIIGPKLSFVTERNNFQVALKEVAYFVMRRLSDREKQVMNLVVRDRQRFFILEQTRTGKMFDYVPPVGSELPAHASSCGKVLLAWLDARLRDEILGAMEIRQFTTRTLASRGSIEEHLSLIRTRGYALDEEESAEGAFCIAVPVSGPAGEVVAGLSFSGFAGGFDRDRILYYRELLQGAAEEISAALFPDDATAHELAIPAR